MNVGDPTAPSAISATERGKSPWNTATLNSEFKLRHYQEIDRLDKEVAEVAEERPLVPLLMMHPGVGPITALATEVFLGDPSRSREGKAVASYVGMTPARTPVPASSGWAN